MSPHLPPTPQKSSLFSFFYSPDILFQGIFGSRGLYKSKRGGGEGGVGRLEWPGCTRICCEPEIRAKGDASLAREYSMAEGRVGSGRVGSGIVGWLLFKGLKSLTDKKK